MAIGGLLAGGRTPERRRAQCEACLCVEDLLRCCGHMVALHLPGTVGRDHSGAAIGA